MGVLYGQGTGVRAGHFEARLLQDDRAQTEAACAVQYSFGIKLLEDVGPDRRRPRGFSLGMRRVAEVGLPQWTPEPLPAPDDIPILSLVHSAYFPPPGHSKGNGRNPSNSPYAIIPADAEEGGTLSCPGIPNGITFDSKKA